MGKYNISFKIAIDGEIDKSVTYTSEIKILIFIL